MQAVRFIRLSRHITSCWIVLLVGCALLIASCNARRQPIRSQPNLDHGWPAADRGWNLTKVLPAGWEQGKQLWEPGSYPSLSAQLPRVANAVFTDLDAQCVICHEDFVTAFANNVHRRQGCEKCHGAASRHLESRGTDPASILSLKAATEATATGRATTPAERAEICLQCHQRDGHAFAPDWRTSTHAHALVDCSGCHVAHYNVPPGTPSVRLGSKEPGHPDDVPPVHLLPSAKFVAYQDNSIRRLPPLDDSLRGTSGNLAAVTPDACYRCHDELRRFEEAIHPHQIGSPIRLPPQSTAPALASHTGNFDCKTCHDPHGKVLAATRKDLCLSCHEGPHMHQWYGSPHDLAGIGCTDCHNPHPAAGVSMSVDQPETCYRCHSEKRSLQEIAGPHQLLGPNGFNCSSCHRPHGRITTETRLDLCLSCHDGAPTMAWHSSIHSREGVACADCHDAHPDSRVPRVVAVSHTTVTRPKRRPMGVNEPATCYKCHPQIYGRTSLPSHHPIKEGKMVCSDCHDGHGQGLGNLKAETMNQLCFECHAEKEGPFVWEHAPVTESCGNCHDPHGTVANNLLHQPTTFLCLRCHTGHSTHSASPQCTRCHLVGGDPTNVGGGPLDPMVPTTATSRQALFTDCTQCHSQIHGSDSPSGFECGHGMRR